MTHCFLSPWAAGIPLAAEGHTLRSHTASEQEWRRDWRLRTWEPCTRSGGRFGEEQLTTIRSLRMLSKLQLPSCEPTSHISTRDTRVTSLCLSGRVNKKLLRNNITHWMWHVTLLHLRYQQPTGPIKKHTHKTDINQFKQKQANLIEQLLCLFVYRIMNNSCNHL